MYQGIWITVLLNLPIKMGVFFRSAVIAVGLAAIGFMANAAPPPRVVDGIRAIMTFTPAASCAIVAVVIYFGYKIEEKHVVQIQDEITARKVAG